MGTKLEYCSINPRSSSESSRFSMHFKDDYIQTRKAKENCESMEREIRVDDMESIKRTMQMHEDMFKHQVRELHRLYSVQKILMDELKRGIKTNRLCAPTFDINPSRHSTTQITCGFNNSLVGADPSSRERSGSCSGDHIRAVNMANGLDLERPTGEEDNSGQDEENEIELTLSIGGSSKKKMAKKSKFKPCCNQSNGEEIKEVDSSSSASFKSERGDDFIGLNTQISSFPWFNHKQDLTPLNNI